MNYTESFDFVLVFKRYETLLQTLFLCLFCARNYVVSDVLVFSLLSQLFRFIHQTFSSLGSINGGQFLTISGTGFDQNPFATGCGKSTVIQLIQRFYDLDSGSLTLEGKDIRSLNLPLVRSNLGIVSQEPTLFNCSIAENIRYGDNSREVTMEEVIEAAKVWKWSLFCIK